MRYLLAFVVFLVSFAGTALATTGAAEVASDGSFIDLIQPVIGAVMSGQPLLAVALALVFAVALARRYAPESWGLRTDIGGTALTFLGSLGAAVAASLAAGGLPSLALLGTALTVAAAASGGYTAVRRLAAPALRWLEGKLPAPLRTLLSPVFNILLWMFEGSKAIAKAEAAGAAAVAAKPANGATAVTGVPRELP